MKPFPSDAVEVFPSGFDHQLRRGNRRKAMGCAGTAQEAVEHRLFHGFGPRQAILEHGLEEVDPPPGNAGFVARNTKDWTGGLAEAAAVAAGDFSAKVDRHGCFSGRRFLSASGGPYFLPGSLPGAKRPAGSRACLSLCTRDHSGPGAPKTS